MSIIEKTKMLKSHLAGYKKAQSFLIKTILDNNNNLTDAEFDSVFSEYFFYEGVPILNPVHELLFVKCKKSHFSKKAAWLIIALTMKDLGILKRTKKAWKVVTKKRE